MTWLRFICNILLGLSNTELFSFQYNFVTPVTSMVVTKPEEKKQIDNDITDNNIQEGDLSNPFTVASMLSLFHLFLRHLIWVYAVCQDPLQEMLGIIGLTILKTKKTTTNYQNIS